MSRRGNSGHVLQSQTKIVGALPPNAVFFFTSGLSSCPVNSTNLADQLWGSKKTAKCPNNFGWDCVYAGILGMGPLDGSSGRKSPNTCMHISWRFLPTKIKDFKEKRKLIQKLSFFPSFKNIPKLARLRHFVPSSTLLNIYRSLVQPDLSYGIAVWCQT